MNYDAQTPPNLYRSLSRPGHDQNFSIKRLTMRRPAISRNGHHNYDHSSFYASQQYPLPPFSSTDKNMTTPEDNVVDVVSDYTMTWSQLPFDGLRESMGDSIKHQHHTATSSSISHRRYFPSRLSRSNMPAGKRLEEASSSVGGTFKTIEAEAEANLVRATTPESQRILPSSLVDMAAATRMEISFHRNKRRTGQVTGRILRGLITRRDPLDDYSLGNLLYTADTIFFDGKLAGRVCWQWSSDQRFRSEVLGTTAFRPATHNLSGHESLTIILSRPLLTRRHYNRDLLLSTFIHELIHCYLFLQCGLEHAKICNGHTKGFERIAGIIEKWIGNKRLRLCNMQARLEEFIKTEEDNTCYESGSVSPEPALWPGVEWENGECNG